MKRFLEILPGAVAWATLLGLTVLSWRAPAAVAVFIVLFDLYWLIKLVYLYIHLRYSFVEMKKREKINWIKTLENDFPSGWNEIFHVVLLPVYKESYEIVHGSLEELSKTRYPKEKMIVAVTFEEKGGEENRITEKKIRDEFSGTFNTLFTTFHPAGIPGELAGKGSNDSWAIKKLKERVIDKMEIPYGKILVSVFDVDTRPGREYFGVLTHSFLSADNGGNASYQPIPVFINNAYSASPFARLIGFSATFWQLMQQARPEQLVTFSSHSMPFDALVRVGYWHTDIVSEDSRIFFQCLMAHNGNWKAVPLFYPVYMDAVEGKTFWEAMLNLYKQQRRWAWGVENFPYIVREFLKKSDIPRKIKKIWTLRTFEGFYFWSTSSFIIFLFGWLPNVIGGDAFRSTVFSYNLPRITGILLNASMIGIITSAILALLLLPPHPRGFKKRHAILHFFQWALMPITFIVFGSVPALESQTRLMIGGKRKLGFWVTPKKELGEKGENLSVEVQ